MSEMESDYCTKSADCWNFMSTPLLCALVLVIVVDFIIKYYIRFYQIKTMITDDPTRSRPRKFRRDLTVTELKEFDGNGRDERIFVAVNGIIFDVTKSKKLYGKNGPYRHYAGRDASRNLAKFRVDIIDGNEYDDLIDLSLKDMAKVKEWELQFREKFNVIGRLLKPGEGPINYEEEESCDDEENTELFPEIIGDFEFSHPQFVDKRFYL